MTRSEHQKIKVVYRSVALAVPAFDRLKDWQRHWERTEGVRLTNGEAIDRLILAAGTAAVQP